MKEELINKFVLLPLVLLANNFQAAQAGETYYYYPAESSEELNNTDIVRLSPTRSLKTAEEVNSEEGEAAADKEVNLASSESEPFDEAKESLLEDLLLEGMQLEIFRSTQNHTRQLITKNIRDCGPRYNRLQSTVTELFSARHHGST